MKKIILLGGEGRRKDFFLKAGRDLKREIVFLPLFSEEIFRIKDQKSYIVKIDPPVYTESDYSVLSGKVDGYFEYLDRLNLTDYQFLNSPNAIKSTLDKEAMKTILGENKIVMAKTIDFQSYNLECLLESLKDQGINNVFIKPRFGSGAVGVMALKCNFKRDDYLLFTSLYKAKDIYFNTKKMRIIRKKEIIFDLLARILEDGPIVEEWIEKSRFENKPYDIRVLVNYKKVDFKLARRSDGPITNLHLNNSGLDFQDLGLDFEVERKIEELAKKAVGSFEGLNCGGVDILLSRSKKLYVIEVNGQGDLLYRDIYGDNYIYKRQIERM